MERDRAIALEYLKRTAAGEVGAVDSISQDTKVPRRTVYRAVERQREWAEKQLKKAETPGSDKHGG